MGETKIRNGLDPRDLDVAIKREHFSMPTIEEIATMLKGAKLFSVFDASNGFWKVESDEESSMRTTFNTPSGVTAGSECRLVLTVHQTFGSEECKST